MAIGVAILGAGIFAKTGTICLIAVARNEANWVTEHLPAVQACSKLQLKAVYSRSKNSATGLVSGIPDAKIDVYYDHPSEEGRSLKQLLARDDIQAVIIALPILTQPAIISQAIEAGKHVLSEKPVAKDLQDGMALLKWYESLKMEKKPLWGVAENFRYMQPWLKGAELLNRMGGKLVTFKVGSYTLMSESSEYYHTSW